MFEKILQIPREPLGNLEFRKMSDIGIMYQGHRRPSAGATMGIVIRAATS
jgi:hypothetical protein